jgi:uncharacterized membrane protein YGL010W
MAPLYPERFLKGLVFYGAYHTNPVNKAIHIVCVPAIYASALVLLSALPVPFVPSIVATGLSTVGLPAASAAHVVAGYYTGYYTYLTGFSVVGLSASALAAGALWGAGAWSAALGPKAMTAAAAVHVFSWVAQFYGHGAHEGRAPALLDNLFDALVLAPLFVWTEVLMGVGALPKLHGIVEPRVSKALADFRKK